MLNYEKAIYNFTIIQCRPMHPNKIQFKHLFIKPLPYVVGKQTGNVQFSDNMQI